MAYKPMGPRGGGDVAKGAKLMVGAVVVILIAIAGITYINSFRPGTISTTPGGGGGVVGASIGGGGTTTVVTTGGSAVGKATDYNALIVNKYSGAYFAAGTTSYYAPGVDPADPTVGAIDTGTPGTLDTTRALVCGQQYKIVWAQTTTTYAISKFGKDAAGKAVAGTLNCPDTTAATASITDTWAESGVTVAAIGDPITESAPTNSQSFNGNTSAPNGFETQWGSVAAVAARCWASASRANAVASNNDILAWNNTGCGGSAYIDFTLDAGSTANSGWRSPVVCFVDPFFNMTGDETSADQLIPITGAGFITGSKTITTQFNQKSCVAVNDGSATDRDVRYGTRQTVRLLMTTTAANWAQGERVEVHLDDQSTLNGWEIVTANTGFAQAAGTRFIVERSTFGTG